MSRLFGQKLRRLREQSGLTQIELAQRLQTISQAHLSNLETGRFAPSLDLVTFLATTLNVTTDYLLRDNIAVDVPDEHISHPVHHAHVSVTCFSNRLRALRQQANLTQERLARQLGLASHAHISLLERGHKSPSPELVIQIADILGVTTDMLLSYESDTPSG